MEFEIKDFVEAKQTSSNSVRHPINSFIRSITRQALSVKDFKDNFIFNKTVQNTATEELVIAIIKAQRLKKLRRQILNRELGILSPDPQIRLKAASRIAQKMLNSGRNSSPTNTQKPEEA